MNQILAVDANVIIHFFLDDNPHLSPLAKKLFEQAESGNITIYIDEMIVAETVWVMRSYYKVDKEIIISLLQKLLMQKWALNPRKKLILQALSAYKSQTLNYIDCWLLTIIKNKHLLLTTFDKALDKLAKSLKNTPV